MDQDNNSQKASERSITEEEASNLEEQIIAGLYSNVHADVTEAQVLFEQNSHIYSKKLPAKRNLVLASLDTETGVDESKLSHIQKISNFKRNGEPENYIPSKISPMSRDGLESPNNLKSDETIPSHFLTSKNSIGVHENIGREQGDISENESFTQNPNSPKRDSFPDSRLKIFTNQKILTILEDYKNKKTMSRSSLNGTPSAIGMHENNHAISKISIFNVPERDEFAISDPERNDSAAKDIQFFVQALDEFKEDTVFMLAKELERPESLNCVENKEGYDSLRIVKRTLIENSELADPASLQMDDYIEKLYLEDKASKTPVLQKSAYQLAKAAAPKAPVQPTIIAVSKPRGASAENYSRNVTSSKKAGLKVDPRLSANPKPRLQQRSSSPGLSTYKTAPSPTNASSSGQLRSMSQLQIRKASTPSNLGARTPSLPKTQQGERKMSANFFEKKRFSSPTPTQSIKSLPYQEKGSRTPERLPSNRIANKIENNSSQSRNSRVNSSEKISSLLERRAKTPTASSFNSSQLMAGPRNIKPKHVNLKITTLQQTQNNEDMNNGFDQKRDLQFTSIDEYTIQHTNNGIGSSYTNHIRYPSFGCGISEKDSKGSSRKQTLIDSQNPSQRSTNKEDILRTTDVKHSRLINTIVEEQHSSERGKNSIKGVEIPCPTNTDSEQSSEKDSPLLKDTSYSRSESRIEKISAFASGVKKLTIESSLGVNLYGQMLPSAGSSQGQQPIDKNSQKLCYDVYERNYKWMMMRESKTQNLMCVINQAEMRECTFKPYKASNLHIESMYSQKNYVGFKPNSLNDTMTSQSKRSLSKEKKSLNSYNGLHKLKKEIKTQTPTFFKK